MFLGDGLEGEARWLNYHTSEQVTEANYLGGVRVMLWKPDSRFQPYGKFLAGVGHITFPFQYATGNYLAMAPGAGPYGAITGAALAVDRKLAVIQPL